MKTKKTKIKKPAIKKATTVELREENKSLKETLAMADRIIFNLVQQHHDDEFKDGYRECYRISAPGLDLTDPNEYKWEIDRDILKQQNVIAVAKFSLIKQIYPFERPEDHVSPVYGKG